MTMIKHALFLATLCFLVACSEFDNQSKDESLTDEDEAIIAEETQQNEEELADIEEEQSAGCTTGFKGEQCDILDYHNPPNQFRVKVDKDGEVRTLNLKKYNARENLQVKVVETDGSVSVPALFSPTPQYIGSCEEESSAIVSASILPNGSLRYVISNSDGLNDWKFIPNEETDPGATINAYDIVTNVSEVFSPTLYPGASYVTPQRGGLTRDGTTYKSHLGFLITKGYVDSATGDVDTILRKAETTITQMSAHNLRDIMLDSKVREILILKNASPDWTNARADFDTYTMDNTSNNIYSVGNIGGGFAYVCQSGGDSALGSNHTYSVGMTSLSGDGTWYGVLRHEYGHSLGSEHFPGNSPEGATIMSGNAKAKLSGDEILNLEWCYAAKGTSTLKASTAAGFYTEHEIPPLARLDKATRLDANGIAVVDVLGNDHDTNGDRIAIKTFDTSSALGGTVSLVPKSADFSRDQLKYVAQSTGPLPDSCGALCSSTDLLLWLDASDKASLIDVDGKTGDTLANLAAIQTWKDKSSHGNDAEVYAAASRPELHLVGSKTIGQLPVVDLDDDLMEIRSLDIREQTHAAITSIAVARHQDDFSMVWLQKGNDSVKRKHNAASGRTVKSMVYDGQAVTELTGMSNRSDYTVEVTSNETGIAIGTGLYAWDNYAGAYPSTISLAELLIFNRKLSDTERQHIESYLAKKWSLKINDQFNYTITDDTGRTSSGLVYVPWQYEAKTDLTAWDGKVVHIRNRRDCGTSSPSCDSHLSWFSQEAKLAAADNTADLVPWKLSLVPGTINEFYLQSTWGCPDDSRCNLTLQFIEDGKLNIVDTNNVVPFEINLVAGTDGPGMTKAYTIRNKYQCDSGHVRCNAPVNFSADRVLLELQYRDPIPWSIEEVVP